MTTKKRCTKCNKIKDLFEFGHSKKYRFGVTSWCKLCINSQERERYRKGIRYHKPECNKKSYNNIKNKFIEMYGGMCICCGEFEKIFLTIDHINGQAGQKRETSYKAYMKASNKFDPIMYRILCHNCNHAVRFGVCPHKISNLVLT